jgi:hypothetical protein
VGGASSSPPVPMSPRRAVPPPSAPLPNPEWFRDLATAGHDVFFRYRLLPDPGYDYLSPSVTELTERRHLRPA